MRPTEVMGIIFSNIHEEQLGELTAIRTMGSVPFGGRYRLIDFPLSNMVNSGIKKVSVITKSNYQSLMDHLESGKTWDLARKRGGLMLFPPFGATSSGFHKSRIEALFGIRDFLSLSKEKYVIISDCNVVANINFKGIITEHIQSGADVTFATKKGRIPKNREELMVVETNRKKRITEILISPQNADKGIYSLNIFVMSREFLLNSVIEAMSRNRTNLYRDIFQSKVKELKLRSYNIEEYSILINNPGDYVKANMKLLDDGIRASFFNSSRPIYTKIRDEMPVRYGLLSSVSNSLIADGCEIEGRVENSILFRGVKVAKGATVKNCILMQETEVGENANLAFVTADKNVNIKAGRTFIGFETNTVFIPKGAFV